MSTALMKLALLVGIEKRELDEVLVTCRIILGPDFEHWDQAGLAVLAIWCGRQIMGMRKAKEAAALDMQRLFRAHCSHPSGSDGLCHVCGERMPVGGPAAPTQDSAAEEKP
jgi:hypothetical protein